MKLFRNGVLIIIVATVCAVTAGCGFRSTRHRSSSLAQYLYPDNHGHIETPGVPHLKLPLHVGIAFIPDDAGAHRTLTETDKFELMKSVGEHFVKHDFVKHIELIPSAYLKREGSFTNLEQISKIYGIDVIALISYDQTQFTDEGLASVTYWTLIGAYIIPGEKNDTHTMVDTAVYDIKSRKMLFRAPGINHIKSRATPVNLSEQLRVDSMAGFKAASAELVGNLETRLQLFKEKVKDTPGDYQIAHRPGYTGGGRFDGLSLLLFGFGGTCGLWLKNRKANG